MTVLLIVLMFSGGDWSPQKPPALLALEANRAGWSRIECAWWLSNRHNDRRVYFANRYGDGDWIATNLGDEQGFGGHHSETGELLPMIPEHTLMKKEGGSWWHEDNAPYAALRGVDHPHMMLPDLRHAGMLTLPNFLKSWQAYPEQIWKTKTPIEYRQYRGEDGRIIVEARTDAEHASTQRWRLDPAKDFQPDHVELYDPENGRVTYESRVTYRRMADGTCFPVGVVYSCDGKQYSEIKVVKARVHEPDMPTRFGPEDIGIDNGTDISMKAELRPPDAEPGFPVVYCQGEIIDVWEMGERIRSGQVKLGHNVSRSQALAKRGLSWRTPHPTPEADRKDSGGNLTVGELRLLMEAEAGSSGTHSTSHPTSQPARRPLTEWERYTLEFARKHRLNDEQVQRVVSILKECEQRRRSLKAILSNKPAKCREQCDKLFEEVLKPRYERLLTRKQRKAATVKRMEP